MRSIMRVQGNDVNQMRVFDSANETENELTRERKDSGEELSLQNLTIG